jgi:hypothetical protein
LKPSPAPLLLSLALLGCHGAPAARVAPDLDAPDALTQDSAPPADLPLAEDLPAAELPAEDLDAPDMAPSPGLCQSHYAPPEDAGALGEPALIETSGLTASLRARDVLWAHNDSGDEARLYAVSTDGRALARLTLPGVRAVDFEDIDAAPCPHLDGPCLWVADTGDNDRERAQVTLYAVPEPALNPNLAPQELEAAPIAALPLRFPDGPVNVEALMVSPAGDRAWLFEKVNGDRARLFAHPGPFVHNQLQLVEHVASFDAPGAPINRGKSITSADLHPSGRRFLLRVYTGTYEYRLASDQRVEDLAQIIPLIAGAGPLTEPQGEAVCYNDDGDGFWTVSEDKDGDPGQPLHRYRCANAAP